MQKARHKIWAILVFVLVMSVIGKTHAQASLELLDNRTFCTKDYLNSDGTITTHFSTEPLHYKDVDGKLQDVDTIIYAIDYDFEYGFAVTKNVLKSFFPKKGNSKVRLDIDEVSITIELENARNVKATCLGSSIAYEEIFPGVDLKYSVFCGRVKEDIVLKDSFAPTSFTYEMKVKGAKVEQNSDGSIGFVNSKGVQVLSIPVPYMYDSSDEPKYGEVKYTLDEQKNRIFLKVEVDREFLRRSDIVYPVVVDPSYTVSVSGLGVGQTKPFNVLFPQTISWECSIYGHQSLFTYDYGHFYVIRPNGSYAVHKSRGGNVGLTTSGTVYVGSSNIGTWKVKVSGTNKYSGGRGSVTYRIDESIPTDPGIPNATVTDGKITWSWARSTDEDYSSGITYNVKVGTTEGGDEVLPLKNIGSSASYIMYLPAGTYYLSVQARDYVGYLSEWVTGDATVVQTKIIQEYEYNLANQPIRFTNANGQSIEYDYGLFGVTSEIYRKSDGSQSELSNIDYEYDLLGNITKKMWNSGLDFISYEYDIAGRLIKKSNACSSTIYKYDKTSNLENANYTHQGHASYFVNLEYSYSPRNWVTSYTKNVNGRSHTVAYQYLDNGVLQSITYPDTGTVISYEYNALNRLVNIKDGSAYLIGSPATPGIVYSNAGFMQKITLANQIIEEYTPDCRNRIDRICVGALSIDPLLDLDYTFDDVGNITAITSGSGATDTFGYDTYNRLVSANVSNTDIVYNLDAMGNRISVVTDGVTVDYVTEDHNLLTQVGDTSLSYDSRGNLISKGNYTYTYDPENRLTMVKENDMPVAEYWYDGLGNRVRSLENGEEIYYIYNGLNIIQEHNATANSRTDYIFVGIRRIAEKTDSAVRYYHTDHLGSTRLMTDANGGVVAEYKYYPYGANLAQSIQDPGFDGAIYRFTGKGDSPNTGLYYFGARFYDPEIGRFITLDPARDGLNWYEYCASNPLMYVDPTGKAGIFAIPLVKVFVATAVPVIAKLTVDLAEPLGEAVVDGMCWIHDTVSSWFATDSSNETADGEKTSEGVRETEVKEPASPNSIQKKVEKGQAPKEVDRVDKPHVPGQKPHVHFKDGTSLNHDGTLHDAHKGTPSPSNKTKVWLEKHGWKVRE